MLSSLLATAVAAATPGASSFFELEPKVYAEAPTPPSALLFAAGPHPVCEGTRPGTPIGDACALHAHLADKPLRSSRLQPIAKRLLERLEGNDRSLLQARLLGAEAARARPCLATAGSELFRAEEGRMIVGLQREALQAYARALRGMDRHRAARILPELARLVRSPYETVRSTITPPVPAGIDGEIDLVPPGLIASLKRLARSLDVSLPEALIKPTRVATAQQGEPHRPRLWREGNELLIRKPDSRDATRLQGDAMVEALASRMSPEHPQRTQAALLAGQLNAVDLRPQFEALIEAGDPAGWVGRVALAHDDDQAAVVSWLLKERPEVDAILATALERFSELAGKRIRAIAPSRWPVPVLKAMIRRSARFELRPWYTAVLEHKDPNVAVLAHASMRKTKPEAWLTARLERSNRCAAAHLRLLMPVPTPRTTKRSNPTKATEGIAEPIGEGEELDDSAGSVVIPEEDETP